MKNSQTMMINLKQCVKHPYKLIRHTYKFVTMYIAVFDIVPAFPLFFLLRLKFPFFSVLFSLRLLSVVYVFDKWFSQ